jgi:hypothetical protein
MKISDGTELYDILTKIRNNIACKLQNYCQQRPLHTELSAEPNLEVCQKMQHILESNKVNVSILATDENSIGWTFHHKDALMFNLPECKHITVFYSSDIRSKSAQVVQVINDTLEENGYNKLQ